MPEVVPKVVPRLCHKSLECSQLLLVVPVVPFKRAKCQLQLVVPVVPLLACEVSVAIGCASCPSDRKR